MRFTTHKRKFYISISDTQADSLLSWLEHTGFKNEGWSLFDAVNSALDRGIFSIELEVADYNLSQEAEEERQRASAHDADKSTDS